MDAEISFCVVNTNGRELLMRCLDAVRATGANNAVVAGGINWGYKAGSTQLIGMNANALRRQNTTTTQLAETATWIRGGLTR